MLGLRIWDPQIIPKFQRFHDRFLLVSLVRYLQPVKDQGFPSWPDNTEWWSAIVITERRGRLHDVFEFFGACQSVPKTKTAVVGSLGLPCARPGTCTDTVWLPDSMSSAIVQTYAKCVHYTMFMIICPMNHRKYTTISEFPFIHSMYSFIIHSASWMQNQFDHCPPLLFHDGFQM